MDIGQGVCCVGGTWLHKNPYFQHRLHAGDILVKVLGLSECHLDKIVKMLVYSSLQCKFNIFSMNICEFLFRWQNYLNFRFGYQEDASHSK